MSSREPLWYCHECHAEMRPLMVPDPACASCRGSFVEKMENLDDDPREFAHQGDFGPDLDGDGAPNLTAFLSTLQGLMNQGFAEEGRTRRPQSSNLSFHVEGNNGTRIISIGRPPVNPFGVPRTDSPAPGEIPTMSEFLRRGPDTRRETPGRGTAVPGSLMAQYLMAMLGHRHSAFGGDLDPAEYGRMGDYVFNQEALDQIISQLMENSESRPVPATEEIMKGLPRDVLTVGAQLLDKDCAVCKEQFALETEDPDEQVVVTLPCHHPFHQPCIIPWLKSSGTCPVCRFALVPQPEHHSGPPSSGPSSETGGSPNRPGSPNSRRTYDQPRNATSSPWRSQTGDRRDGDTPGGLFQSLFGNYIHPQGQGSSSRSRSSSSPPSSNQTRSSRGNNPPGNPSPPGSWMEDLD